MCIIKLNEFFKVINLSYLISGFVSVVSSTFAVVCELKIKIQLFLAPRLSRPDDFAQEIKMRIDQLTRGENILNTQNLHPRLLLIKFEIVANYIASAVKGLRICYFKRFWKDSKHLKPNAMQNKYHKQLIGLDIFFIVPFEDRFFTVYVKYDNKTTYVLISGKGPCKAILDKININVQNVIFRKTPIKIKYIRDNFTDFDYESQMLLLFSCLNDMYKFEPDCNENRTWGLKLILQAYTEDKFYHEYSKIKSIQL